MTGLEGGLLGRQTAHEFVREFLRRAILSGDTPGGARLVQADIAERLRVSTTPVREALRDLVTEGLVDFNSHRGAIVHQPNLEEVLELYAVRELVEPLALQLACRRDMTAALDTASRIQAQLESTGDPGAWADLNWHFHAALTAPASRRLRAIVKTLQDAAAIYVARVVTVDAHRMADGNVEHSRILKALQAGDVDSGASHLRAHMASTLQGILRYADEPGNGLAAAEPRVGKRANGLNTRLEAHPGATSGRSGMVES